jgi:hypothetical protein
MLCPSTVTVDFMGVPEVKQSRLEKRIVQLTRVIEVESAQSSKCVIGMSKSFVPTAKPKSDKLRGKENRKRQARCLAGCRTKISEILTHAEAEYMKLEERAA